MPEISPIRPTDDDARRLARALIDGAAFGALAVKLPETGAPLVARIAIATDPDGVPMTLISDLSQHTGALRADPVASLLVGEPAERGDPLTHPRLTLQCRAEFTARDGAERLALRDHYLAQRPKARLYIDFADFSLVRLAPIEAFLNGGFGNAFVLTPADLALPPGF